MNAPSDPGAAVVASTRTLTLAIDGTETTVPEGTTIYDAARRLGIEIPVLCHDETLRPVGVCRMCVVEVEGARTLPASCVTPCAEGMTVRTSSPRVTKSRKVLSELLLADQPPVSTRRERTGDDALRDLADELDVDAARWPLGGGRHQDESSVVIHVDHQACILCDRCLRACDEIQHNDVIGRTGKGYTARITFDLDVPMGDSTCVECGECVSACPTSALVNKSITVDPRADHALEAVASVCPYCGVGCALTYHVDREANRVVRVEGRTPSANEGRLCVKGRYGFDYATHPHRLEKPLIRREAHYPKQPLSEHMKGAEGLARGRKGVYPDYEKTLEAFREATWDEALDLVAARLGGIKEEHGPQALAGFGSAKCSTEEAYLFQKMVRAVFGTNNVDHCTRLCHASSVAALLETIGSGAVTTVYKDALNADFILVTGSNVDENHPVAATFLKEAAHRGTKLLVVDPRRCGLADHAWKYVRIESGTDVAFYNALMHVILEDDLQDDAYIREHTENVEALRDLLVRYTPEAVAPICGVPAGTLREIAREIGDAKSMIVYWGMGIAQHVHGTDNARSLINLCLLTGNVGRRGAGLHPLRGQNNVQGASDAGLIPMMFPDYASVADDAHRARFEEAWGVALDPTPGMTVVEIAHAAEAGAMKGMYILGENPFLTDPNVRRVREAFCHLDFLVVQDIFLTETAEVADVVLPATSYFEKTGTFTNTDRRVQRGRHVLEAPGEARLDWEILCDVMTRMGYPQRYDTVEELFVEFADLTTNYRGLRYRHLDGPGKLWPCPDPESSEGTAVLFDEGFPTASGRGTFSPAEFKAPGEATDAEFPFVLMTGRTLAHWHSGSMTRRATVLDALVPEAYCEMNPDDLARLGIEAGGRVRLATRRGRIVLAVRPTYDVAEGSVFVPFHFREASANLLTSDELDPVGRIPGFKYCAARVEHA